MSATPPMEPTPGATAPPPATEPTPTQTAITDPTPPSDGAPASILGEAPPPAPDPFDAEKLTVPDGFDKTGSGFEDFSKIMKDCGISHKQAQALSDLHANAVTAVLKQQMDSWHEQQVKWQKEIEADPEIGGRNLPQVKQTISRVFDNPELAHPKVREALNFTGGGNNYPIVWTIYQLCKAVTEGGVVTGGPAGRNRDGSVNGERPSAASALYGPSGPFSGGPNLRG